MAEVKDIEQVFLCVLQEDSNRNEINKRIQYFEAPEWEKLYELATKNGLFPIFYHQLLSLRLENLPTEFLSKLKNLYFLNLKRNIILEQELLKVITHLNGNGIPAIPLKGPVLARFLYNDLGLRQASCDLDLLVKQEKIEDAEYLLKNIGYTSYNEDRDGFLRSIKLKYARQLHFGKIDKDLGCFILDLHWDTRGFFIDTPLEDFWQNSREINLNGYKVLMPSNIDLLFYLSLASLSTFEFVELKYLYDIHTVLSKLKGKLHWQEILKRTETHGLQTFLFFSLRLSQSLFHTDIPEYFLSQLRPNFIKENILKISINPENIFRNRQKIASSYIWRYLQSSYLSTRTLYDFFKKTYKKIFLPMNEVMGFYNQPCNKKSYWLYAKRLLEPIFNKFKRGAVYERIKRIKKEFQYCFTKD